MGTGTFVCPEVCAALPFVVPRVSFPRLPRVTEHPAWRYAVTAYIEQHLVGWELTSFYNEAVIGALA